MGFEFLAHTQRTTVLVTALAAMAGWVTLGAPAALAIALGSTWSLINFRLLSALVRQFNARGSMENPLRALLILGVKGPLLYLAGYALLRTGLPVLALVLGFHLVFAVVLARAIGHWLTHPEWRARAAGVVLLGWALCTALAPAPAVASPGATPTATRGKGHAVAATGEKAAGEQAKGAHSGSQPAGAEHSEGAPEMPNLVTYLRAAYAGKSEPGWVKLVHEWENVLFSILAAVVLIAVFGSAARARALVPAGTQNAAEALLGGLHDFFLGILGPEGKAYIPFVGSLCLYIVAMNWMGMVPFLKSPNTSLNTTFALALCVFVYVQWIGISKNGFLGYLYHFAGQPKDAVGWGSAILLFPLEIMGELIKPISLSCRLFGNILGEDILLAVFVGLGVTTVSFVHSPIGLPLQLPFLALSALFGLIQGLVFSLLTTVYIVMMLPHGEHHGGQPGDAHAVAHH